MRLIGHLTVVTSLLVATLGCTSTATVTDAAAVADGAPDGPVPCFEPLSSSDWLCAGTFTQQVENNACNDRTTTTQSTCGQYQVWRNQKIPGFAFGHHACIYDSNHNGALVGGETCGTPDATCTNGCIEYGNVLVSQLMSCGPQTSLCSPPP